MEPERPVEKLLRGYAKRRREQAGEPPPMHPAVRRQLLFEVTKTYGRQQSGGGWWLMLKGFWPRLALGAGGMAVLMTCAAIWIASGNRHAEVQLAKNEGLRRTSSALALEKNALSDAPSLAPDTSDLMTNSILLAQSTPPPPTSPVASFEMKYGLQAGAAQYKEKDATAPILAANAPSRELQEEARDKELSYGRTAAASGVAQPEPSSDALIITTAQQTNKRLEAIVEVAKTEAAPAQDQARYFQNTSVTQLFRNQMPADGQAAPAPVMAQFRVEQEGAVVRIIDNDGSVYTGSLQEAETAPSTKPTPRAARSAVLRSRALPESQSGLDQAQNFRLEATGTNRTLNQKVVFSGNLVGNQISLSNTTQNQQAARQNQKLQQQLSNVMRISGNARVGAATDQPVEAVPFQ